MNARLALVLPILLLAGCATPTLAQRQANWRAFRDSTRATCVVGRAADPAMPEDVRAFCEGLP